MTSDATHSSPTVADLVVEHLASDEVDLRHQVADLAAELVVVREQRSILLDRAREAHQRITQQAETIGKLRAELRALLDAKPGRAA